MKNAFIQCRILDPNLAKRYEGGIVSLEMSKAKALVANKTVQIIGATDVVDKIKKTANEKDYLRRKDFTSDRNLKIAWVQDYSKDGGAELSNFEVVKVGQKLGYDIVGITPNNFTYANMVTADLIILNNILEFSDEQFKRILYVCYEARIPYIKYDHDYRELKRINISSQLFHLAKGTVFISPSHKNTFDIPGSIALPLCIDPDKIVKKDKVKNTCLVPCVRKCQKNLADFMKEYSCFHYTIIGQFQSVPNNMSVRFIGQQGYRDMLELLATHENVYHRTDDKWAGERIYLESVLSGCETFINENVGHTSWAKFPSIKELKEAPYRFWDYAIRRSTICK